MTRRATNTPPVGSGYTPPADPASDGRFTLVIPGQPVSGKNSMRPRFRGGKFAGIAKSEAAETWAAAAVPELARQFARYGRPTLKTPVAVGLAIYYRQALASPANPDGDNVQAAVWDALTAAHVIADDRLVWHWWGSRHHDARDPRVEVTVTVLQPMEAAA